MLYSVKIVFKLSSNKISNYLVMYKCLLTYLTIKFRYFKHPEYLIEHFRQFSSGRQSSHSSQLFADNPSQSKLCFSWQLYFLFLNLSRHINNRTSVQHVYLDNTCIPTTLSLKTTNQSKLIDKKYVHLIT